MSAGLRLDLACVRQGLLPSRQRAVAAIRAGLVLVNGRSVEKPGLVVNQSDTIEVLGDPAGGYVSRGALKLKAALDHWQLRPGGQICLDAGASTGGFTEVLIERGAALVYAVDVGAAQLHPRLRANSKVVVMEHTDVRRLAALPGPSPTLITADLSFISLTLILPHLVRLGPSALMVVLIKPQFELGPGVTNRRGVVADPQLHQRAIARVVQAAAALGLRAGSTPIPAPVRGSRGNQEYLLLLEPDPAAPTTPAAQATPAAQEDRR